MLGWLGPGAPMLGMWQLGPPDAWLSVREAPICADAWKGLSELSLAQGFLVLLEAQRTGTSKMRRQRLVGNDDLPFGWLIPGLDHWSCGGGAKQQI